jgi:hypothetical protein
MDPKKKATELKKIKEKIIRHNTKYKTRLTLDTGQDEQDLTENRTLYNFIWAYKWRTQRVIHSITTETGRTTTTREILREAQAYFNKKYDINQNDTTVDKRARGTNKQTHATRG